MHRFDQSRIQSPDCSLSSNNSNSFTFTSLNKGPTSHPRGEKTKPSLLEALCKAFRNNSCSLNSPFYKLDQVEFCKVLNSLAYYKSRLPDTKSAEWCVECGESSSSYMSLVEASKEQLVCYILAKKNKVLGKMVVKNAERKLIVSRLNFDGNSNLQLLRSMDQLTSASIKDRYQVPTNHTKLSDVGKCTASRLQIFAVVTAVNKVPTRTKASWHSLLCLSDPSLITVGEDVNEDLAPCEFKMHLFMPLLEDHPEIHRGDVVRFTNVKIESHQNRCDGRIFNKADITVYCFPDSKASLPRENFEERITVVRILSHWWTLNHRFFDYLTPHPIYHLHSRYAGVRTFKELSDQLICDLNCQVVSMSEGVSDLNFLCLRDGTIFTLQERPKIPIDESAVPALVASDPSLSQELRPSFGYLALAVFEREHWKRIKSLKITVNDYVYMREVKVVFLTEETLANLSSYYSFRHPCVLFRPAVEGVKKLAFSHHEAYKIRSRLHRLPQELEQMATWKLPPPAIDEEPEDPLLARLNDPSVQMNLLKRLKRS